MLPDHPRQLTIFDCDQGCQLRDGSRKNRVIGMETNASGKYVTAADAALFADHMIMIDRIPTPSRRDHSSADLVSESRLALTAIETAGL